MTTQLWSEIMGTYNQIPFVQKINPDLTDFVTRKALDGLFVMVAKEEAKSEKIQWLNRYFEKGVGKK